MKRIVFGCCLLFFSFGVKASGWDEKYIESYVMNSEISESISCEDKVCISTFIIPNNYDKSEISIVPKVFNEMIDNVMPGDTYEYKIVIKNESNNEYVYLNNSFYVKPFQSSDNVPIKSYAGANINNGGVMYRINSSKALMNLYDSTKKLSNEELSDEKINEQLIIKGYKGIDEMDQYILDYIGFPNDDLESHSKDVAKALWPNISEMPTVKESNASLIKFGYDYFYNILLSMHLNKSSLDDEQYAIGNWERNKDLYSLINKELLNYNIKKVNNINLNPIYFHINGPLTNNPYVLFEFGVDFGFKLKKVNNEVIDDNETASNNVINNDIDENNNDNEISSFVNTGVDSNILLIIIINSILLIGLILLKEYMKKYVKAN